uniref:Endoribonuclease YSH1 n=1 Tax=Blastobotrys adeninivorans TaxID=409370 RepID=A0A060T2H7_BLAAD
MSKRENESPGPEDQFSFVALGGGSEVGRSCHIISYKGKTVMLDAGVHPAHSGMASLPFYDEYDLSTVDVLLISHFHLDHAASLPYVMQHTNFRGRVFMTHPTKAIYRWLLGDFVKVSGGGGDSAPLYTDEDLFDSFERIETVDYHATMEVSGIRFTAYHAGHVLGAAMYMVEIAGLKVFFTGDYSREADRHLNSAEIPPIRPDILISESTYGTGVHEPRTERETRLTKLIHSTIEKGGRCLLPVFALGRAQELLLILEEYWATHPELQTVKVYYASALARKCMAVFRTYVNMMNDDIRRRFRDSSTNPFEFRYIRQLRSLDKFDDLGPCVMVAAPGMLQNGVSRELLERWAPDSRNALIITGYSVEGTMAKKILTQPTEIPSMTNPDTTIPRRLSIAEISFAAHVDFNENSAFIDAVGARHVILVHGEATTMGRLKSALLSKYTSRKGTDQEVKIYNPKNCVEVELPFKTAKVARVTGVLADKPPNEGQLVTGVLVEKDFHLSLLHVNDLREYSGITTSVVTEKQTVTVDAGPDLVRYHLEQMFGEVEVLSDETDEILVIMIMNAVRLEHSGNKSTIEWIGNVMTDAIADSVLAVLLSVDSSPASVKMSSKGTCGCHSHEHDEGLNGEANGHAKERSRIDEISALLKAQFGDCYNLDAEGQTATIKIENMEAKVNFSELTVECPSAALKKRVEAVLDRSASIVAPLTGH